MTGLLASQGLRVSQQRVEEALQRVHPGYQHARITSTARKLNPIPYHADYIGHKFHIDQNEKVVMFGVTHIICAVDGFSGKVVGFITMPVKNNVEIYTHLYRSVTKDHFQKLSISLYFFLIYRPTVQLYGMWDTLHLHQGKEWYLMLFVQEQLAHMRRNTSRAPHLQTTSKMNQCVERF